MRKHLTVVTPRSPTAKPAARAYADFDKWLALGIELNAYHDEIVNLCVELECDDDPGVVANTARLAKRALARWPRDKLVAAAAGYVDGWEFYNRDELFEAKGDNKKWRLARSVISEQVAILVGGFPNAPQAPTVYTPMLIEEIAAADPCAVTLEAACRWLRRNCTFVPSVGEVLKSLQKVKMATWDTFEECNGGYAIVADHRDLEAALAALPVKGAPE
jgi:hypothetical protein